MRWVRFAVLIVVAAILQISLIDIIAVTTAEIKPDLLLILLVFFAIYSNPTDAIITSFATGFVADLVGSAMGPQMISFGIFGTLLAELNRVISIRTIPYQALAIFVTGIMTAATAWFLMFLKAEPTVLNVYVELLWKPLYSAIAGPFLFLPVAWLMRIRRRRRRRY